jgi:hypothetical protein
MFFGDLTWTPLAFKKIRPTRVCLNTELGVSLCVGSYAAVVLDVLCRTSASALNQSSTSCPASLPRCSNSS